MTSDVTIRRAREADAPWIVSLFRDAMGDAIAPLVVIGIPRASAYLRAMIRAEQTGGDLRHWVADDPRGRPIGFLQLRLGFEALVLNQVHVAADHRGRGCGTALVGGALSETSPRARQLFVDAFLETPRAHDFYRRLGFVERSRSRWWTQPIPAHPPAPFVVRNLPAADAAHARLGVSMLTIETERGVHDIGRLGSAWYRVGPEPRQDPGVVAAMRSLDDRRDLLVIAPEAVEAPNTAPISLTSVRYVADTLDVVRAGRSHRQPGFVVSRQP